MKISRLAILIGLIVWPLSLLANNTFPDFLKYIFPFFEPKLLLFPIIFFTLTKNKKLFLLSLILFALFFNRFWGQTIFKRDYEAEQLVIRQTQLYPNTFLARLFHNKARIYIDKFNHNFFALTDPNNYFFRFHPREISVSNQNLKKFPSLAIIPVLFGFYYLGKNANKTLIISLLIASVISLSVLTAFDRHDIILWIPLSLIFVHGIHQIQKRYPKYTKLFFVSFIVFSSLEILQILIG